MVDLSLIILCLNEREALPGLLEESLAVLARLAGSWEIIVADGGSTDGTLELLAGMVIRHPGIRVRVSPRAGYGRQLQDALNHAEGRRVAYMDGDGQYHPEDLPELLNSPPQDLVSACRRGVASGWLRRRITGACARLARGLAGAEAGEVTAGYKVLPGGLARELKLRWGLDFLASTEIVFQALSRGLKVHSRPVTCTSRSAGRSKLLSLRGGVAVAGDLFRLVFTTLRTPRNP